MAFLGGMVVSTAWKEYLLTRGSRKLIQHRSFCELIMVQFATYTILSYSSGVEGLVMVEIQRQFRCYALNKIFTFFLRLFPSASSLGHFLALQVVGDCWSFKAILKLLD